MNTYIDINDYTAFNTFSSTLESLISNYLAKGYKDIVFLCIGSDRSTGDSLGPIIGYKLSVIKKSNIYIYGTLEKPVHAKNLSDNIQYIYNFHLNPLVVAIDACLGSMDHVGYINIKNGPLKPGSGVSKDLPSVGDISIAGIVNLSGFMDYTVLQNTRLNLVMKMADLISLGVKHTIYKIDKNPIKNIILEPTIGTN